MKKMKKILSTLLFLALFLPFTTKVHSQCTDGASMCSITVNARDSYGDGWGSGAFVKIYQGNILRDSVTVASGSLNSVTIQVCPDSIRIEWQPGARDNYECYFDIVDIEGNVIYSVESGDLGNAAMVLGYADVSCPSCFRPQNFTSTANTATSVSLQWTENSTTTESYEIMYASHGFSPDALVSPADARYATTTTTSLTINDLSDDTIYDFYIRSYCSNEEYSQWAGPVTIHPGAYNMATSGNASITSCGLTIYDDGGVMNNYSNGCNATLTVYPENQNSLVTLSGILAAQSNCRLTFYDGTSTSAPEIGNYAGNNDTPVTIPQITSTSGPITIKFYSNYSTTYSGFELHTSCVDRPTCAPVQNIAITNLRGTSAMVEWSYIQNLGDAPSMYEFELIDSITNMVMLTEYTTEPQYLLSDLLPQNKYILRIRSYCDNGDNGAWSSINFETPCLAGGDITIGNGTNVNGRLPLSLGKYYSYSQQIYDATEFDGSAQIASISVEAPSTTSTIPQNRNINVYLGHTTQSTFTSTAGNVQNIPLDSLKLVYSGTFSIVPGSWNTIVFDSIFNYNGTSNLVVAIDDNSGIFTRAGNFRCHSASSKSIYYESDDLNPDPATSLLSYGGSKGVLSFRNNMIFGIPCDTAVTCVRPDVYIANVEGNEIELLWAPGYNETAWDIEIKESTENEWILEASGVTNTSYTIYDLAYNTAYDIRITALCGNESESSIVSTRTECSIISELPFTENFDTWATGNNVPVDQCWGGLTNYSSASFVYPNATTNQALSGTNSIWLYSTATVYSTLIFPSFDADINTLKVSFSALKPTGVQHQIQVGVITDPTDVSTFVALSSVDVTTNNVWENFEVSLDTYSGPSGNIAIMLPAGSSANRYIDNVIVNVMNYDCESIANISVSNITSSTASVSWIDSIPSLYAVEYGAHGFEAGTGTFDTTSNTSYTISGLSALTQYDVYVYRVCGDDFMSDPSGITSFTTTCAEIDELPFVENFDTWATGSNGEFPQCWNRLTNALSVITYVYANNTQSASSPNSLYMQGRESYYSIVVLPKFATSIESLQISLNVKRTGGPATHGINIGIMTDPDSANSFTTIGTITPSSSNVWQSAQLQFDSYTGADGYIAIRVPTGMYPAYYIDDITVDYIPTCVSPNNVVSDGFEENGIKVDWTEMGTATQWDICYGATGFDPESSQARIITNVTSHPYTITNLSIDTVYDVYVRSICGNGSSDWSASHLTTYPGVYTLPTHGADTIVACDARIYDDGGANNNYSNQANSFVVIYPSSEGNVLSLSGTLVSEQTDYLKIFDGPDTTGTPIVYVSNNATINCTSSIGPLTLLFRSDYGLNYAGFDLRLQCIEVSCYMVQNLRDSLTTSNTATIAWNEIGNATQWEVEYGTTGFAHGNGTSNIVSSTSHTITNLLPQTSYDVYVRAVCGVDDASEWQKIQITTGICDDPIIATIGTGTNGNYNLPFYTDYAYSYSQQIYTAQEIGLSETGSGMDISSLALQYMYDQPINRNISIYMGHTTDSVFSSGHAWLADSLLQQVYAGTINWNNSQSGNWVEVIFDSTFSYNGADNIVVAIMDNTGSYVSSYQVNRFYTHTTTGNKALYRHTDDNQINIASPGSGSTSSNRNNIRFVSCGLTCSAPSNFAAQPDRTSAILTWDIVGNYEVSYKKTADDDWSSEVAVANANTYTVDNILPETSYDFRIRKICDSTTYSDWATTRTITTAFPCATPTALSVSNINYTSAELSWQSNNEEEDGFRIAYGYGTGWDTITVTETSLTLTGLYPSTEYTVYVQSICEQTVGVYSDWSEALTFTTTSCDGVSNITASEITSSTATITWTPTPEQTEWEITYGMQGVDEENGTKVVVEGNPTYTIEGLESGTTYDVYVRSKCAEDVYSTWSNKFQFTTTVGISTAEGDNANVNIYPNPANSQATITVEGINGKVEFAVADMNGRMIVTETINCDGQLVKTIDVSNMAKGAYFVYIYNDKFNATRKLIVK